jgi:DNA-binding transcriptional LysR family regulator
VFTTDDTACLLEAARVGAGVAVLPTFVAGRFPDLVRVSADTARSPVWLVTHPEFRRDRRVKAVASFLRRNAAAIQ